MLQTTKRAGSSKARPLSLAFINAATPLTRLTEAATSTGYTPGRPAAPTASATGTASPAASATGTPATAAAATPTAGGNFFTQLRLRGIFLVENIEGGQADVGDLLLTEKDFMTR